MGIWRLHLAYSPFYSESLSEFDYAQTDNLIYFVHLDYEMQKLTRAGHTDWTFADVTFEPNIDPPANVAAAMTQPNATGAIATNYKYYVTAIGTDGQESRASTPDDVNNDLSLQGNYNTITWDAVTGAEFYAVYRGDNDDPGYIGVVAAPTVSFKDRNLQSVRSDTPPRAYNPFTEANTKPSSICFHQQRLTVGRSRERPNAIFASQTAAPENMDKAQIVKPDDSIAFALLSDKVNSVNQLISMKKELLALTSDAIWTITGGEQGALTPQAIVPERETGRGASRRKAKVVDSVAFYEPMKSEGLRALGFTFEIEGYRSSDVSIFSSHLFKGYEIVDMTYQETPWSIVWIVRSDGALLAFTWEEEQQVWGFARCETEGHVERITVINEGGQDRLYALIRRTIAGVERRFHERLALPHTDDPSEACHLDCSVTQTSDTASDLIDGLWHLEGETVSAVYDGWVEHGLVVENGRVTLPEQAYIRTAGLRYEGLIETLPPVLGGENHTQRQTINDIVARCIDSRGLEVSTDGTQWDPFPERLGPDPHLVPDGGLQDLALQVSGNWSDGATLQIRQQEPLPAHVAGLFIDYKVTTEAEE